MGEPGDILRDWLKRYRLSVKFCCDAIKAGFEHQTALLQYFENKEDGVILTSVTLLLRFALEKTILVNNRQILGIINRPE